MFEKCSRRREEAEKLAILNKNPPPYVGGYEDHAIPNSVFKQSLLQKSDFLQMTNDELQMTKEIPASLPTDD